MNTEEKKR